MCKYYIILNGLLESTKEMGSSTKVLFRNNSKENSDLEPTGREVYSSGSVNSHSSSRQRPVSSVGLRA
jgi:hypothetical protein